MIPESMESLRIIGSGKIINKNLILPVLEILIFSLLEQLAYQLFIRFTL